jgi:hypothetical protein
MPLIFSFQNKFEIYLLNRKIKRSTRTAGVNVGTVLTGRTFQDDGHSKFFCFVKRKKLEIKKKKDMEKVAAVTLGGKNQELSIET